MIRYSPFALIPITCASVAASSFSGIGRSIDGDSLMVGHHEVRLFGIDAPEFSQTCTRGGNTWACGAAAADQLSKLVAGKHVNCVSRGKDMHGRTVARCNIGGIELNRFMVATGYALAFRRYSMEYVTAEESAKSAKRGIWSGKFQPPGDVRRGDDDHELERLVPEKQSSEVGAAFPSSRSKPKPNAVCKIKGNRSRKGERIYHLPGRPYYAETVAEQIFCTEADARAAGYRRSRAR